MDKALKSEDASLKAKRMPAVNWLSLAQKSYRPSQRCFWMKNSPMALWTGTQFRAAVDEALRDLSKARAGFW